MANVPPGIPAEGSTRIYFARVVADVNAPKIAELQAVDSMDISCYLVPDGWKPELTQEKNKTSRLCLAQDIETLGKITATIGDLTYVHDPQNKDSITNKAAVMLAPGLTGFLVSRVGMPYDTPLAAGQMVKVYPVQLGVQNEAPVEAGQDLRITQAVSVTGEVTDYVALVA